MVSNVEALIGIKLFGVEVLGRYWYASVKGDVVDGSGTFVTVVVLLLPLVASVFLGRLAEPACGCGYGVEILLTRA